MLLTETSIQCFRLKSITDRFLSNANWSSSDLENQLNDRDNSFSSDFFEPSFSENRKERRKNTTKVLLLDVRPSIKSVEGPSGNFSFDCFGFVLSVKLTLIKFLLFRNERFTKSRRILGVLRASNCKSSICKGLECFPLEHPPVGRSILSQTDSRWPFCLFEKYNLKVHYNTKMC